MVIGAYLGTVHRHCEYAGSPLKGTYCIKHRASNLGADAPNSTPKYPEASWLCWLEIDAPAPMKSNRKGLEQCCKQQTARETRLRNHPGLASRDGRDDKTGNCRRFQRRQATGAAPAAPGAAAAAVCERATDVPGSRRGPTRPDAYPPQNSVAVSSPTAWPACVPGRSSPSRPAPVNCELQAMVHRPLRAAGLSL